MTAEMVPDPAAGDVAVVIAAFRAERTIAAALASVMRQRPEAAEIVVVDDGSEDGTARAAAAACPAARIIRLAANRGVAAALNVGVAATRAPLVMFLDADDLWAEGAVAALTAPLVEDAALDGVFGMTLQFTDPAGVMAANEVTAAANGLPAHGALKSAFAIRRAALDRVGPFDEAFHRADFVEWLARARHTGLRTARVDTVVHHRRLHAGNLGRLHTDEQRAQYADVMRAISARRRGTA